MCTGSNIDLQHHTEESQWHACDFSIQEAEAQKSSSSSTMYQVMGWPGLHEILMIQTKQSHRQKLRGKGTQKDIVFILERETIQAGSKAGFLASNDIWNCQARF